MTYIVEHHGWCAHRNSIQWTGALDAALRCAGVKADATVRGEMLIAFISKRRVEHKGVTFEGRRV